MSIYEADRAAQRRNGMGVFNDKDAEANDARIVQEDFRPATVTGLAPRTKALPGESEWDRVQRMRKEGHHLIKGGRSKETPVVPGTTLGAQGRLGVPIRQHQRQGGNHKAERHWSSN